MFRSVISVMRLVRDVPVVCLMVSFIQFSSQIILSSSCSSLSIVRVNGVGGGYAGYAGNCGVNRDLCMVRGVNESVDFVL